MKLWNKLTECLTLVFLLFSIYNQIFSRVEFEAIKKRTTGSYSQSWLPFKWWHLSIVTGPLSLETSKHRSSVRISLLAVYEKTLRENHIWLQQWYFITKSEYKTSSYEIFGKHQSNESLFLSLKKFCKQWHLWNFQWQ